MYGRERYKYTIQGCSVQFSSVAQSCLTLCDPMNCSQPGSVHGDSPGKNTEIGCHALLQGIFPTQGSNPLLPHSGFFTSWATRELHINASVQFRSVAQSCPTLCDPMNYSTPGLLVHHQLPEFTQTHIHRVSDTIQPSHPLSSPSPPAPNPSQHQNLCVYLYSEEKSMDMY